MTNSDIDAEIKRLFDVWSRDFVTNDTLSNLLEGLANGIESGQESEPIYALRFLSLFFRLPMPERLLLAEKLKTARDAKDTAFTSRDSFMVTWEHFEAWSESVRVKVEPEVTGMSDTVKP